MYKIGIIGLGLIGGSIAKALKSSTIVSKITAFDLDKTVLEEALCENSIDSYSTQIDSCFADADFIFICTPVNLIYFYVKTLSNIVKKGCILTDVGSTKFKIVSAIEADFPHLTFVGGHPMVGSEKSGFGSSFDFLFENAYYIITKSENTTDEAVQKLESLIKELRAIPICIDIQNHDFIVSMISHVPHIIASRSGKFSTSI